MCDLESTFDGGAHLSVVRPQIFREIVACNHEGLVSELNVTTFGLTLTGVAVSPYLKVVP
jgi:hypothetical protein